MPVSEGPLSTERRRLIATGIAAAVVALFIGWAFGRAGPGTTATDDPNPSSSTTPTTTTPGDELGATVPVVDPDLLPTTTAFSPVVRSNPTPTTTSPPGWTLSSARVDERAAALDIRIVGSRPGGEVVELDTGSGELAAIATNSRFTNPPQVDAGDDWILLREMDQSRAWLFSGRNEPRRVEIGDVWSVHRQPNSDLFWSITFGEPVGNRMQVSEIDHEGNETGIAFAVDSPYWIAAADAINGVVVYGAPGGTYHVGPDGAYRLTSGQVIALGSQKLLATDCGENLTCGLVVIDRATGEATPLIPTLLEPTHRGHVAVLRQPGELRLPNAHVIGLARQPLCTDHHERARPGLRRDRSHHRRVHPVRRLPRIGLVVVARQHRARCTSSTATSRCTTSTSGRATRCRRTCSPCRRSPCGPNRRFS